MTELATPKSIYAAIEELKTLFEKTNDIINYLPNDVREALLNEHSWNTNLVHSAQCGARNANQLLEQLHNMDKAYLKNENGQFRFADITLPYKSETFPIDHPEDRHTQIVFIPEFDSAGGLDRVMTCQDIVEMVECKIKRDGLSEESIDAESVARRLFESAEKEDLWEALNRNGIRHYDSDNSDSPEM